MRPNEALWYVAEGRVERRAIDQRAPGPGFATVTARFSGLSRGTERLVLHGKVPASEHERMCCPHQEGVFPFPVKYGYALSGVVTEGPQDILGTNVFVLHPHQRRVEVAISALHKLPEKLPLRRACLAANMETALNIIWDAEVAPGSKVLVVGGGVLGLLTAGIAARIPQAKVTVTDINPARANQALNLGAAFTLPAEAPRDQDIVIHTSATEAGLQLALASAAFEGKVVEASWFGDTSVSLPLGEAFHSRRLRLISSQVGSVAPSHRAEWSRERRMAAALELLCDERYDALITGEIEFDDAPALVPQILDRSTGFMTVLRYT